MLPVAHHEWAGRVTTFKVKLFDIFHSIFQIGWISNVHRVLFPFFKCFSLMLKQLSILEPSSPISCRYIENLLLEHYNPPIDKRKKALKESFKTKKTLKTYSGNINTNQLTNWQKKKALIEGFKSKNIEKTLKPRQLTKEKGFERRFWNQKTLKTTGNCNPPYQQLINDKWPRL